MLLNLEPLSRRSRTANERGLLHDNRVATTIAFRYEPI
jgi:hypothetical protein